MNYFSDLLCPNFSAQFRSGKNNHFKIFKSNSMKILLLLFCFLSVSNFCVAQDPPKVKYGKPTEDELQMKTYALDTTADAVILYDEGSSVVNYDVSKNRFMLEFERFVRVKILKQEGSVWGDFTIPLYSSDATHEEIMGIDGLTFNTEGGKTEKCPLKKESIFRERENKYWENIKLSMPKVKVGSIVDLRYKITSPILWNLQSWRFQYTIPVKWSQYEVRVPEYLNYNRTMLGYHSLYKQNSSTKQEKITYTETTETAGIVGSREQSFNTIEYMSNINSYAAKDVPALKQEPYLTTLDNYVTKIKFELASTDFTKIQGSFKSYTNSWQTIVDQLFDDADFGGYIRADNFTEDIVKRLIAGKTTEWDKVLAIYNHVKNTVKWDEMNAIYPSKSLRKSYSDKKGNSADINLILFVMLKAAGLTVDPVLLSTRKHRILSPSNPTLSDLNYVIVRVMVDQTPMLLDATEPNLPAGSIPFRCLNGKGILIRKGAPEDVLLMNLPSRTATSASLELVDGKLSGKLISKLSGEDAYDFRESVRVAGGSKEYFEKVKNNSTEIKFLDYTYTNLDSIHLGVDRMYQFQLENSVATDDAILYISPMLTERHQKNPFISPTREYPVDFGSSFVTSYIFSFKIPEGYQVEELPKAESVVLGDKDGSYVYQATNANGLITINIRFRINKTLFLPSEYEHLRKFYDMIISKESEQIVLKKLK